MSDPILNRARSQLTRHRIHSSSAAVLTFCILFVMSAVDVERTCVRAAEPITSATAANAEEKPAASKQRANERTIKAWVGLVALAGIVITGVGLAALIVLWAGRLRRQIRQPTPGCEAPERDFWFLKPPKPTVNDSAVQDSHLPPHDSPPSV